MNEHYSMRSLLQFYFSFKGRATRYDFNVRYMMLVLLGGIIFFLLDFILGTNMLLSKLWHLLSLVSSLAVICRRLHDMNYSGWWLLPMYAMFAGLLITICVFLSMIFLGNPLIGGLGSFLALQGALVFYLASFLFLSAKRGTIGPNKYGNDPLQTTTIETQS